MPVSCLTATQRERYGRYPGALSADEIGRYFHPGDDDQEWIAAKQPQSGALPCVAGRWLWQQFHGSEAAASGWVR